MRIANRQGSTSSLGGEGAGEQVQNPLSSRLFAFSPLHLRSLAPLLLLRPRLLYALVLLRLGALPVPIVLLAPLSFVQFGLWLATRVLKERSSADPKALEVLQTVRSQIGQLRLVPSFALVETTVKGKMTDEMQMGKYKLHNIYVKVGLM